MSFQQLYYTSCEHGLSGFAGFQFNAVSEGVDPRVMRRVEQLTAYDRPSRAVEPGSEPVNLCHALDETTGTAVTARVVYAGLDPSGRPGNYFAHALATATPQQDFGELLPVELWDSPVWRAEVVATPALPLLDQPPQGGHLDRVVVAEFLAQHDGSTELLAALLTAADRAVAGGRPVILRSATSEANARWIAAVSYLLSGSRAMNLSFATYSRRPDRTPTHIVGTVPDPDSDAVTAGLTGSFSVFDLVDHRPVEVEPHPVAQLLAEAGPVQAAGLWRQAATLAAGDERTLEDWYPVVAAAYALMNRQPALPTVTLEVVARWLPPAIVRPTPLPSHRAEAVVRVLLERAAELPSSELRELALIAERTGAGDQLFTLDSILLDRAIHALQSGQTPDVSLTPLTVEGRAAAAQRCAPVLAKADADGALSVLDWARLAGVAMPAELVQCCGREVIGPALERFRTDERLARVGVKNRPLLSGIAENLAAGTAQRALKVLDGIPGKLLDAADLNSFPRLRELILLDEVGKDRLTPVAALREVAELRGSAQALTDAELLHRLWPQERWTLDEARTVLDLLEDIGSGSPAVSYLSRALDPPRDAAEFHSWLTLVNRVHKHPIAVVLPETTAELVHNVAGVDRTLQEAAVAARHREPDWYAKLEKRIRSHSPQAQHALWTQAATLIIDCPEPAAPLVQCVDPVFEACCQQAYHRLRAKRIDYELCARLIMAVATLEVDSPRYQQLGMRILRGMLLSWRARDRRAVRRRLKKAEHHGYAKSVALRIKRVPRRPPASLQTFHHLLSARDRATPG